MRAFLMHNTQRTEAQDNDDFNRLQVQRRIFAQDSASSVERAPAVGQLLRVLIIDEDRDATDALAKLVRTWGHTVQSACNGAAGLELATVEQPDVVLLGIALFNLDAFAAARQLREHVRLKTCFIIAVASGADDDCRRQCMEAGIDLFLVKPVDAFVLETLFLLEGERLDGANS